MSSEYVSKSALEADEKSHTRQKSSANKRHIGRWLLAVVILAIALPIIKVTMLPPAGGFDGYNYSSFREVPPDNAEPQGPAPGEPFPTDFSVYDLNGSRISISSLWADKPLVLEFGSVSCPIFQGNGPSMEEIYQKYDAGTAEKARVGLLYVREAHPGWFRSPHDDISQKLTNANLLREKGLTRTIWIDSVDGSLHQLLGPEPNSVYVIDTNGTVAYKSVWNAPSEVDKVLDDLVNRGVPPSADASNYCTDPRPYYNTKDYMLYIARIAVVGGPDALADFIINLVMTAAGADAGDDTAICDVAL